ncbi:AsmA family protein [Psychroflexus salis]|uniref:AsmA-like C-terminal region n=1 Tax=Psychroflexus salis TaxID=1526574 RepID=A0A916ZVK3_9FLAO|nr:AsmA-like C-terminal region-containing protein [Psychroflexus salis]GGE15856.1 hypothetical protein GCM10010831_16440 [Psychroflexus salis]
MKRWKKFLVLLVGISFLIFIVAFSILWIQKDQIIQGFVADYNQQIEGEIKIEETIISPFTNFPYISIDVKGLQLLENKTTQEALVYMEDVYVGFDLWELLQGDFHIKSLLLNNGQVSIIQDYKGRYNIVEAFNELQENQKVSDSSMDYFLKKIELQNILFTKESLQDSLVISTQIKTAKSSIQSIENALKVALDLEAIVNVSQGENVYFVKEKYTELHTNFSYDLRHPKMLFEASELVVSNVVFSMQGEIDVMNDVDFDLKFAGLKENFDLLIGLAPPEVEEALRVYENKGEVFFEASIQGKSIKGFSPLIEARFGCENGFFDNIKNNKKLSDLRFLGTFTNGKNRNSSTSELNIQNLSASPEAGIFKGNLRITNFDTPEINLELDSDFDLNFLTKFLNLNDLSNLTGQVRLKMNFNDIVDLENPELALEEFNQSYYSELEINQLNFTSDSFHLPIKNLNVKAKTEGNLTQIRLFQFNLGQSDLSIKGNLTNLPDLVHQTNTAVEANLAVDSDLIDFTEITSTGKKNANIVDEKLHNFSTKLKFTGAANTFLASQSLPVGTFYIEKLIGKLQNYPHELHDFFAQIYISPDQIEVQDFKGMVDDSDFHFSGKLTNYNLFLQENPKGDAGFNFDVDSKLLRLKDVFTYQNENYVPADYQQEVLREIQAKGTLAMHFQDSLVSTDFQLNNFEGRMRVHPLNFKDFSGKLHFENRQITFDKLEGKIGKSHFSVSGNYYLGNDEKLLKQGDEIHFKATYLDLDELTNYNELSSKSTKEVDHDDVFNVFEVPFRNTKITAAIGLLNYHNYNLKNFTSKLRMQENHFVYIDDMRFEAAGGKVTLSGYFNGSNSDSIYFNPDLKLQNVNLDQLLFKFDNFGQDQVISENLHGIMTGRVQGKVLLHTDLTPYIEKSNLKIEVSIQNGRIENFEPMQALSDFFNDKNLNKVLFGSLENRLELKDGSLVIPNMLINSSLGYMQLSGKQNVDLEMDYYLRIPLKMVTQVAAKKLFGSKKGEIDPEQEDDIIYKDKSKNTNYVNVRMQGKPEDYSISLRKNKNEDKGAKGFQKGEEFLFEDLSIEEFEW